VQQRGRLVGRVPLLRRRCRVPRAGCSGFAFRLASKRSARELPGGRRDSGAARHRDMPGRPAVSNGVGGREQVQQAAVGHAGHVRPVNRPAGGGPGLVPGGRTSGAGRCAGFRARIDFGVGDRSRIVPARADLRRHRFCSRARSTGWLGGPAQRGHVNRTMGDAARRRTRLYFSFSFAESIRAAISVDGRACGRGRRCRGPGAEPRGPPEGGTGLPSRYRDPGVDDAGLRGRPGQGVQFGRRGIGEDGRASRAGPVRRRAGVDTATGA